MNRMFLERVSHPRVLAWPGKVIASACAHFGGNDSVRLEDHGSVTRLRRIRTPGPECKML
jgi:hypothetical protein